jgi:hypothetical protein
MTGSGEKTATFPVTYTTAPKCVITPKANLNASSQFIYGAVITSISTTQLKGKVYYIKKAGFTDNGEATEPATYIAIGY